ncbi:MAG: hypothetical protein OEZ04_02575 [Nitrospinota bacterium]|nr:hypothetical protein [Nitrospinota bacterium]
MTPKALTMDIARRALVFGVKRAITKEGMRTCLTLLASHIQATENKVDDEILRVFGPAASHVLAGAKAGMTLEEYESLVFEALESAALATPAAWDDVIVSAAQAVATSPRKARGR